MTPDERGFKMLKQQYATPFRLPVSLDIWEKRGMFDTALELEKDDQIDLKDKTKEQ